MPVLVDNIPVTDSASLLGYGLFETLRLYENIPFLLSDHLFRLHNSAMELGFRHIPSKDELTCLLHGYIDEKKLINCAIRLSLTYGSVSENFIPRVFITHRAITYLQSDYANGIAVAVAPFPKNELSPVAIHKTFNQLENLLAFNHFSGTEVKEAIMLNTKGFVAEGTKSNIFFVRNKQIHTPSLTCGILPGITRKKIMDLLSGKGFTITEGSYGIDELKTADECFCTNSLMEIMPIVSIDNQSVGSGKPGEITKYALSLYHQCISSSSKMEIIP